MVPFNSPGFVAAQRFSPGFVRVAATLCGALLVAVTTGPARGADGSWNVNADGNFDDTANWLNGIVGTGNGFTSTYANDITATRTVTVTTSRAVGNLVFGDADPATSAGWVLARTGTPAFTLNSNSATLNSVITVNNLGANVATISLALGSATLNSPAIEKNGVGTLVLSNASNPFTAKLAVTAGSLQVSADGNLGATPGTFTADRITLSGGGTLRTTAAFTLNGNRGFTIGSGGGVLNLNGGALSYAGRFTGAGQTVTTSGPSGLTLNNTTGTPSDVNWDFTGGNTRIFVNTTDSLGTGTSRVRNNVRIVNTSATTLTLNNAITLDSGAGLASRAGLVTFSNVTFPSSGTVVLNKDDPVTPALTVSSGAALTGNLTVDMSPGTTNAVGDVTLSGVFSGASGAITKAGTAAAGKLILGGANTYQGNTTINTGTLAIGATGSIANSAAIVVASGATFDVTALTSGFTLGSAQALNGAGTVSGNVTADGTLAPGMSGAVGTLSLLNNLSLGSGSILSYQLDGGDTTVGGAVNDLITLGGDFTLDGTINVAESVPNSFLSATVGNSWRLFNYTGTLTDNTLSLGTMPALGSGLTFGIDTGTTGQVNLVVNAVPEPATIVTGLIGLGLTGLAAARRRRNR